MTWQLRIAKRAAKALKKLPVKDQGRIVVALNEMRGNPFSGDIVRLNAERSAWRRRVGNYRIFFDVYTDSLIVDIVEIERRTSKTY